MLPPRGMSGYPVAAVRRAFVVSYSCLDLTDSSTSSAATTWSSFIAASQRRPCEELKQPPSSKTSSRKTRKSSWRGSRATTGEGTSDRPATTPETAAAERPAIDTTACTRPRRGKSGCWSLPDRMGILTDPVRQVTMALGMMRGVVDALARLRS